MADAIRIGDPAIEVALRRNARARRMVLRVAASGRGATLTLPPGIALAHAAAFLNDHEGWIRRNVAAVPARDHVGEGSVLPFGDTTLTLQGHAGRASVRDGNTLLLPGAPARFGPRAAAWLAEEARRTCVAGVDHHAGRLKLRAGRVRMADPRARWGSCTAAGDLMFSWRLIMAPVAVLDYVVAHEVAHLAELNHSPRFWAVVRQLCPDYEPARDWLRRNGAALHRHDFSPALP